MQNDQLTNIKLEITRRALMDPFQYYDLEHSEELYLFLRHLYVRTVGSFSLNLNREISQVRPIKNNNELDFTNLLFPKKQCNQILKVLRDRGYAQSPSIEGLSDECDSLRSSLDLTHKDNSRTSRHIMCKLNDLYNHHIVRRLCRDKSIKYIADNYLNCNSILNLVCAWKTSFVPKAIRTLSSDAQLFHFDCDHNRFLKIFLYLDDVDRSHGPHVYIPYTSINHRYSMPNELQKDGRISNIDVIKYGLVPEFISGKKGTFIFGDTHSLHKGTPVTKNSNRYVLQLQYVDSTFGAKPIFSKDQIKLLNQ